MRTYFKIPVVLFVGFFVFACSTDDDPIIKPEPEPEPAQVLKGVFLDSPVEGLYYETETEVGTTNAKGEFNYLEGETVTFSVGPLVLGTASAAPEVTPVSIAVTANANFKSPEVKNIAAFLQSLDSDNNASNGITIKPEVAEAVDISDIDFTKSIIQLLGELTAAINSATGSKLVPVYPEAAAAHLAESLGETYVSEDYVFLYFVPVIESLTSVHRSNLHWIHETDESGKLVKSTAYEKIPYRIAFQYVYSEHNAQGQPTKYEESFFRQGFKNSSSMFEVSFEEDQKVKKIEGVRSSREFTVFDEENRILGYNEYREGVFTLRFLRAIDDNGHILSTTAYTSLSDDSAIYEIATSQFNEDGQGIKDTFVYQDGAYIVTREYFYRPDGTMEREVRTQPNLLETRYYDENENIEQATVIQGEYSSEYVEFYPTGNTKRIETYHRDVLIEVVTFNEDNSSEWKIINKADNTYRIEYKDPAGTILNTEYYDAEGNLL